MSKYYLIVLFFFSALLSFGQLGGDSTYQVKTVVIDAGHGGKDPGCHGSIANEKDVCLSIALKLGEYIKKNFSDVKVIYTRETDVFLELHERATIANKNNADLFISIHANSASPNAYGTETYVMGLKYKDFNKDNISHENAVIYLEEDYEKNYELDHNSPKAVIMRSIIQQEYLKNSVAFAEKIEYQFKHRVGRHSRGVKQKVLFVMYRTSCPSVLIETGFLTNQNEEKFLNSDEGQTLLSSAIYRAFREYKLETEGYSKEQIEEFVQAQKDGLTIDEKKEQIQKAQASSKKEEGRKEKPVEVKEEQKEEKQTRKERKQEEDNKEVAKVNPSVYFSVQVASSGDPVDLEGGVLSDIPDLFEYQQGGWYKYASGKFTTFEEVLKAQSAIKAKGYNTAFIVAFENGERIALEKAKQILKSE